MVRIESKQPRKQRKARYTAPAHARNSYLRAPLAPALREQYHRRSARVVTGDTVRIAECRPLSKTTTYVVVEVQPS